MSSMLISIFIFTGLFILAGFFMPINPFISTSFFGPTNLSVLSCFSVLTEPVFDPVTSIIQKMTWFFYIKKAVTVINHTNI